MPLMPLSLFSIHFVTARNDRSVACQHKVDALLAENEISGDGNGWECNVTSSKIACAVKCSNGHKPKASVSCLEPKKRLKTKKLDDLSCGEGKTNETGKCSLLPPYSIEEDGSWSCAVTKKYYTCTAACPNMDLDGKVKCKTTKGTWSKMNQQLTCKEPEPKCAENERDENFPIEGEGQWKCKLKKSKFTCSVNCQTDVTTKVQVTCSTKKDGSWQVKKSGTRDCTDKTTSTPSPVTSKATTTTTKKTTQNTGFTTTSPLPYVCGSGHRAPSYWKETRCTPLGKDHYCADNPAQTKPESKSKPKWARYNYGQALHNSILFYEAQRSGVLPKSQRVNWRGDAHLNDGCDVDTDLTGGWYDAGDMVKFMFPGSAAATLLAWSLVEFGEAYEAQGEMVNALRQVKWYGDYLVKASPEPGVVYGQVGDGQSDHQYWGRAENMDTSQQKRDTFVHGKKKPASDLSSEMSAALSAIAKAFKLHAAEYHSDLFGADDGSSFLEFCDLAEMVKTYETHARWLLDFAESFPGKYSDSNEDGREFYASFDNTEEPIWAAVWMAYNTEKASDLVHAKERYNCDVWQTEIGWDNKMMGTDIIYHKLSGDSCSANKIKSIISDVISRPQSPNGLTFVRKWGSARYAANFAFYMAISQLHGHCGDKCWTYLNEQVNYILGDGTGHSLVVGGPGPSPPRNPHHSGSFCPPFPAECSWTGYDDKSVKNHFTLYGALVGGPDATDDKHKDDRTDFVENEVAVDYNAGFQGALAGILHLGGDNGSPVTHSPMTPTAKPTTKSTTKPTIKPGECKDIKNVVMSTTNVWWGGGGYEISNIPAHEGYTKALIKLKGEQDGEGVDVIVTETWFPFDSVNSLGNEKWELLFISGTEDYTDGVGFNVQHNHPGKDDVLKLKSFKFCS